MKHSRNYALYCAGLLLLTGISASAQPAADKRSKEYWDNQYARDYGGEFGNGAAVPAPQAAPQDNSGYPQGYPQENQGSPQGYSNYPQGDSDYYYQGEYQGTQKKYVPPARARSTVAKPRRTARHAEPVKTSSRHQSSRDVTRHGQCLPGFHANQDARGNYSCKSQIPRCPNSMAFQSVAPADAGGEGQRFEYRCFTPQQ